MTIYKSKSHIIHTAPVLLLQTFTSLLLMLLYGSSFSVKFVEATESSYFIFPLVAFKSRPFATNQTP